MQKLGIKTDVGYLYIEYNHIFYIKSLKKQCIVSNSEVSYTVNYSLKDIQNMLDDRIFYQCHRSYLVNTNQIAKWMKNKSISIEMKDGVLIPVSRNKVSKFKAFLSDKFSNF